MREPQIDADVLSFSIPSINPAAAGEKLGIEPLSLMPSEDEVGCQRAPHRTVRYDVCLSRHVNARQSVEEEIRISFTNHDPELTDVITGIRELKEKLGIKGETPKKSKWRRLAA
jgi:hypothetical protein